VIALLVLFVLTAMGLSVSFVSQTELLIGSQERTIQRVFFAADSGLQMAASRALNRGDTRPLTTDLANPTGLLGADLVDRIETSVVAPIHSYVCNLCQINQGNEFFAINHGITSRATRLGRDAAGTDDVPLAQRTVSAMLLFEPWTRTTETLFLANEDSSGIELRF
jgi:hypothetical protein